MRKTGRREVPEQTGRKRSENLERVLSSTNLIENLFSRVREMARRVRRWQGGAMILRRTAAGGLEAERNFRHSSWAGRRPMSNSISTTNRPLPAPYKASQFVDCRGPGSGNR